MPSRNVFNVFLRDPDGRNMDMGKKHVCRHSWVAARRWLIFFSWFTSSGVPEPAGCLIESSWRTDCAGCEAQHSSQRCPPPALDLTLACLCKPRKLSLSYSFKYNFFGARGCCTSRARRGLRGVPPWTSQGRGGRRTCRSRAIETVACSRWRSRDL